MEMTTVVVMTEFGRRVRENASFGTDHGRGSVMFVLGGGVRGGRVIADWRGLRDRKRSKAPAICPWRTNYRQRPRAAFEKHGADDANLGKVFSRFSKSSR